MPDETFTVRDIRSGDDGGTTVRFMGRLFDGDHSALLKKLGARLVRESKRAFREQKLGEIGWLQRYPNQGTPHVNVAGVVADLAAGKSVSNRRLDNPRPALKDTGTLQRSLSSEGSVKIEGPLRVSVGTNLPYAQRMHGGGKSTQAVTDEVRTGLTKFLKSKRGKPYRSRLGFLYQRDELQTESPARPFVGVTPDAADDMKAIIARHFASGGGSRGGS